MNLADGDIVALCDQDDVWLPNKLERCIERLSADPLGMLVIHSGRVVGRDGAPSERFHPHIARDSVLEQMGAVVMNGMVPGFALVFRRSVSDALWAAWPHEQYRAAYSQYGNLLGHDILLYAAARSLGRIHTIAEPLVHYRVHGGNVTARVEALVPGQSNISAALKQTLTPNALTYRHMAERWGAEVDLLSTAFHADPRLEGLLRLQSYLNNQSRMFGARSTLYAESSRICQIKLFSQMVLTGAYRDRKLGYLGVRSAIKDGAVIAGLLPKGAGVKTGRDHHP